MKIYKVESYVKGDIYDDYIGADREKAFAKMESVWTHWTRTEQTKNSVRVEEFEIDIKDPLNIDAIKEALEERANAYGCDVVAEKSWKKREFE